MDVSDLKNISPYCLRAIEKVGAVNTNNASLVIKYVREQQQFGWKPHYKSKCGVWACRLSELTGHKNFQELIEEDIQKFAAFYNKGEIESDRKHHWKGTYNQGQIHVTKFLKFVYYPHLPHRKRPKPEILTNFVKLRRQEKVVYEASDMWSDEDNAIFIKYCSGPKNKASHIRNQAYHMVARDTMGRPCDLLGLKVGDFDFDKNMKYVDIMIGYGGKTGPRRVTLTDSVPYVMRWLELHHQKHNKDAYLFYSEKTGTKLDSQSIHNIYKAYKRHFIRLSRSKGIPEEDGVKIQKLLQKPFAPYLVGRHTSYNKHRKMIKDSAVLRQYAGWVTDSKMPAVYEHLEDGEARVEILKYKGIIVDDEEEMRNILAPKICPLAGCRASNVFDALSCSGCGYIFSFEERQRLKEEEERVQRQRDNEIKALRDQTKRMSEQLAAVIEQQQQHADASDMKLFKLLDIVKTGFVDQDEATKSFISTEIVKMMPRKLTTKELQKIEAHRNLTGVFS